MRPSQPALSRVALPLAPLLPAMIAATGCTTTNSLLSASDSLDRRTERFYDEVRRDRSDDRLIRDADALADAADDFQRSLL